MKRRVSLRTLCYAALVAACSENSVAPPTTGSITVRIVTGAPVAAATDAPPAPPPAPLSVQGHLDAARVRVLGPTNKTVNLTAGPSGFSGTVDGLPPGGYTVVVEGLVASEVDYFGVASGVQVTAGGNTSPTIAFNSFRPVLADLGPPTAGMTFTANFSRVAGAQGYRVEWDKNPGFPSPGTATATDTFGTFTVADTGTYNVRVRATNGWEPSGRAGDPKSIWLVGTPPAIQNGAPLSGLAGSMGSQRYFGVQVPPGQIQLSVGFAGGTGNVNLYVQSGSLPTSSTSNFCAALGSNPTQCSFSNPAASTWYLLLQGVSAYSNVSLTAAYVSAAAPSNLAARPASLSEIDLSWTDNATDEDGFRIERCAGPGCTSFAEIATAPANAAAYANTGLPAGTNYSYRVRAYNAAGTSAFSVPAASTTPFVVQSSVATNNLAAATGSELYFAIQVPTGQGQLTVTTSGGTGDVDLSVRFGSVPTALAADCRPHLSGNAEQCNISNPSAGTWYIVLYGTAAFTGASLTATYAPLATPTGLTATVASSSEIDLAWTDTATNVVGYQVEQCQGQGCSTFAQIANIGTNVTSYQNTGLAAGTSYSYRVRAYSSASTSAYSSTASATTLPLLVFTMQPASVPVGRNVFPAANPVYPAVEVTARDGAGATVPGYNAPVTLTLGTNPCGAVLSGGGPVVPVNGVATFPNLAIDKVCIGYTLIAASSVLTSAPTSPFNISIPGDLNLDNVVDCLDLDILLRAWQATDRPPADINKDGIVNVLDLGILLANYNGVLKLAFTGQPSDGIAKAVISPPVQVAVENGAGKTCGSATDSVTIALTANPSGATLSGTATVAAAKGVATFGNLSVDKSGTGYTLTASASGMTGATSGSFNIAPFGAPATLGFIGQPTTVDVNTAISPQVRVAIEDAQGNVVTSSSASVTLSLGANPGSATLSGTLTVTAVSGVASFPDLKVNAAASGYTLAATSQPLTSATSAAFTVVDPAAATKLAFVQQPTTTTAGSVIIPAVTVAVQNRSGQTVTSDNSTVVSLSLASAPIGGTLHGTRTATAVNGIATFNTLSDTVSGVYTLSATATGLTSATSNSYTITAGVPSELLFLSQPSNTEAGKVFGAPIQVAVADQYGNTVTSATHTVTITWQTYGCNGEAWELKFQPNPYPCAGFAGTITPPLVGTLTLAANNGVATFNDLRPRFTEVTYLYAQASGVNGAGSNPFTVSPSTAAQVWAAVPWYGGSAQQTANVAFTVHAYILDSLDNQVNAGGNVISLAIGSNPSGAVLNGASSVAATNGEANFIVSLDKGGSAYTLAGSSTGLASLASFPFDVAPFGTPTRLGFVIQPSNSTVGARITPAVQVCVQDGVGNTVTTANNSIAIAIGANPGGATLGGTLMAGATNGCATFSDLTLSAAGSGYTLTAGASGLSNALSATFNVTP